MQQPNMNWVILFEDKAGRKILKLTLDVFRHRKARSRSRRRLQDCLQREAFHRAFQ